MKAIRFFLQRKNQPITYFSNNVEISQLDAFATPVFHLASGLLSLTADSGINPKLGRRSGHAHTTYIRIRAYDVPEVTRWTF
jgi:hypothetical protein